MLSIIGAVLGFAIGWLFSAVKKDDSKIKFNIREYVDVGNEHNRDVFNKYDQVLSVLSSRLDALESHEVKEKNHRILKKIADRPFKIDLQIDKLMDELSNSEGDGSAKFKVKTGHKK